MRALVKQFTLICIGLVAVSLFFTSVSPAEIDPLSVIAAFLFDDDTETKEIRDESVKRHTAKVRGKVDYDEGKFGQAIEFPAGVQDSCLDFEKPLLNNLEEFTIVFWVNRSPNMGWVDQEAFVGQHDVIMFYTPQAITLMLRVQPLTETHPKTRNIHAHPPNHAGCFDTLECVSASFKLPGVAVEGWSDAGDFVHLAATGNQEFMTMYYNGRRGLKYKVNNLAKIGPLVTYGASNESTKIAGCSIVGPEGGVARNSFPGLIDELAIFNKALEREDIKAIMELGLEETVVNDLRAVNSADKLALTWGELKTTK